MHLQLILADRCASCEAAEALWRDLAPRHSHTLEVLLASEPAGARLVRRLGLLSLPALVAADRVRAVGLPTAADAAALLRALECEDRC